MIKKTLILCVSVFYIACFSASAIADPIVELAAPRIQPKFVSETAGSYSGFKTKIGRQKSNTKNRRKLSKVHHKKKTVIVVNYSKLAKMIEDGYYDDADYILNYAIAKSSKDIKAKSLKAVSLAKQGKCDFAQKELNILLKQYPSNSNLHYAQGIIYYQRTSSSNMIYRNNTNKLLSDALNEFTKAIMLDKSNARALNAAGVISIKLGQIQEAIAYFQKAIAIDKTYSLALDNLGTIDFAQGKFKAAEMKFRAAILYNPSNSTAMYHLAQISLQKNNYNKALEFLNNASTLNPYSPAIYNLIGKIYANQGNEAAAINAFRQSIFITPEFLLSYLDLADVYEKRGDDEFALEQLKTALSICPTCYDARLKLADISLRKGDFTHSTDAYAQLLGVQNYNDKALKGLANSYYMQAQSLASKSTIGSSKNVFAAITAINKAIEADALLDKHDLELHLAKLKLTKIANQPGQTKVELNKIIESKENDLATNVIKGEAYLACYDYQNANKVFEQAIKLSATPDNDAYLAEILIYNKQYELAQDVLNKILKYDSQNQSALNSLDHINKCINYSKSYYSAGKKFIDKGNVSAGIDYLQKSVAVDPNNSDARLLLAQTYECNKNYPEAVANYKAYLGLCPEAQNVNKVIKKIRKLDNEI